MKKRATLMIYLLLIVWSFPASAQIVSIPDDNLRTAIADELDKASGDPITTAEMEDLIHLDAPEAGVHDLTGLEHATNLTHLDFWNSSVSNLSPVAGLTNLTHLSFAANNAISDVSALVGLTNLTALFLNGNSLSDISSLAGLTKLTRLSLSNNSISDISALAGLTNLTLLKLRDNSISDISPLVDNMGLGSGDEIDVRENPLNRASIETHIPALQNRGVTVEFDDVITELVDIPDDNLRAKIEDALDKASGDPITTADMAQLTSLDFQNANISDLTGLEAATNLTLLILVRNNISDLSPLEGLINLMFLWLDSNNISDLSPLVANTGLGNGDIVVVNTNPLSAVSIKTYIPALESRGVRIPADIPDDNLRAAVGDALGKAKNEGILWSDMARLRRLDAPNANISDLTGLEGAINLTRLNLGDEYVEAERRWINSNSVSDLSPVAGLTNLAELYLGNNMISDISAVAGLTNLESLYLRNNTISDISPVAGLTNLESLNLNNNTISDISPVAELTNLTTLWLNSNSITDISVVSGLTNLRDVDLLGNTISDISAIAGLTNLEFLVLGDNSISDISAVAGLTNLRFLLLVDNSISDLSPLVENMGLGEEDWIGVEQNPLSFLSIYTHIPALQSRGAEVRFDPLQPDLLSGHNDGVVSVAFSSHGMIASGSNDSTARLWDPVTESTTATLRGHNRVVRSVAFSTDGSILASGSHDGTIILWDVASGQPQDTIMGHADWVWSLAFSPDGTLAIGRNDGTILLWDVATGQPKDTLIGHTVYVESVAFSPDGSALASGSLDTTVRLWDVATGRLQAILPGHREGINSVAFNPDGTMLASGSDDSTVRLWDVSTGQLIAELTGHMAFVRSVAFSPDGTTLASGSGDGTIRLWEIAPPPLEFLLSIPDGISLIHVPLKVTAVEGMAKTIESVSDLYDVLNDARGGADIVNFLITYDSQNQEWLSYFGPSDKDTPADRTLTDDTGIIAGLKAPVSVSLTGNPLGTDGNSTITLNQGLNVVGIPLNDSRINRVSDLFALQGIGGNVPVIILTDGGDFKLVGRAGDPGDIEVTGGQAFTMTASQEAVVDISGDAWTNDSGTAAAPSLSLKGIEVGDTNHWC